MIHQLLSRFDKGRPFTRHDFCLFDLSFRQYFVGNIHAFGWRFGVMADLGLLCPLFDTIRFYGKRHLSLTLVNEDGSPLDPLVENAMICRLSEKGRK